MKKFSLLALAIATAFSVSAQTSVLKDAERAMKDGKEAAEVVKIITPAFSDPSTKELAQTYFIPGKASFKQYDELLGLSQFNKLPANGEVTMGKLLIQGYEYFVKTLPLDSLPNEKGKIKPKYSKEIIGTLTGHLNDYLNAGANLYNAQDYNAAYAAWDIFITVPQIPEVKKALGAAMPTDTVFGEIAFNQALAAWQAEKLQESLDAFSKAKSFGYNKKQLYDYAIAVATGLENNEALLAFAKEALPLYGKEDPMYMGQVVNYYLQNKDFDKAFEVIDNAIELEPNNAQYYVIKGVLFENKEGAENKAQAKAMYEKAVSLDPNNAQAVFNYGRQICDEAYTLADAAPTRQDEYAEYFASKIKPLFVQAAEILENAYNLDAENTDILRYLENIYYNLNDEAKLNDVKKRMTY